jgi:plastocyanin domain-containing protein
MYLSHKLLIATLLFLSLLTVNYVLHLYRSDMTAKPQLVTILINNGVYQPATVRVSAGKSVRLHFVRGEPGTTCTDHVSFPQFNLVYALSATEPTDIDLPPMLPGEVAFQCQAGTYRGKLVIS